MIDLDAEIEELMGRKLSGELKSKVTRFESMAHLSDEDFEDFSEKLAEKAIEIIFPEFAQSDPLWLRLLRESAVQSTEEFALKDIGEISSAEFFYFCLKDLLSIKKCKAEFFRTYPHLQTDVRLDFLPFFGDAILPVYRPAKMESFIRLSREAFLKIPETKKTLFCCAVSDYCLDFFEPEGEWIEWNTTEENLELVLDGIVFAVLDIEEKHVEAATENLFLESYWVDSLFGDSKILNKIVFDGRINLFHEEYRSGETFFHPNVRIGLTARALVDGIEDIGVETLAAIYGIELPARGHW